MKKLLSIFTVVLLLALIGLFVYGVIKYQIKQKEVRDYDRRMTKITQKYGEKGVAALALLEKVYILEELGQNTEAMKSNQQLLEMDLDYDLNSDAIWRMTGYYQETGESDRLVSELRKVFQKTRDSKTKLEALLSLTNHYRQIGQLDKAVPELDKALEKLSQ